MEHRNDDEKPTIAEWFFGTLWITALGFAIVEAVQWVYWSVMP